MADVKALKQAVERYEKVSQTDAPMKYLVSWDTPLDMTDEKLRRAYKIFAARPSLKELTIHAAFNRVDNRGGFMVIETSSPEALMKDAAMFNGVFHCHVTPVMDLAVFAQIQQEALAIREIATQP